jgi:hypothetical protein
MKKTGQKPFSMNDATMFGENVQGQEDFEDF